MNTFLHDLALAHQQHEGYYPGSYAYRNNNPGNIRGVGGAFIHYPTYAAGFVALEGDLQVKIFGTAGSVLRYIAMTGKPYENLTMQDYVAIYAPSADHNNPIIYCDALCKTLARYKLAPGTPLSIMAQLVRGQLQQVPDPPAPEMTLTQRLNAAKNALRFVSPERATMLQRLIFRIQDLLAKNPNLQ